MRDERHRVESNSSGTKLICWVLSWMEIPAKRRRKGFRSSLILLCTRTCQPLWIRQIRAAVRFYVKWNWGRVSCRNKSEGTRTFVLLILSEKIQYKTVWRRSLLWKIKFLNSVWTLWRKTREKVRFPWTWRTTRLKERVALIHVIKHRSITAPCSSQWVHCAANVIIFAFSQPAAECVRFLAIDLLLSGEENDRNE